MTDTVLKNAAEISTVHHNQGGGDAGEEDGRGALDGPPHAPRTTPGSREKVRAVQMAGEQRRRGRILDP